MARASKPYSNQNKMIRRKLIFFPASENLHLYFANCIFTCNTNELKKERQAFALLAHHLKLQITCSQAGWCSDAAQTTASPPPPVDVLLLQAGSHGT